MHNATETRTTEQAVPVAYEHLNADGIMSAITEHVHTEINYYRQLLRVMEQERDILLKGRHDELMPNCESKLALSEELATIQKERQRLAAYFNTEDFAVIKLSQLIPLMPEEDRAGFREMLVEADTLSRRMSELNQLNRSYINEALDSIGHMLSILSGQQAGGYTAKGSRVPINGRRILTREV